MHNWMTAFTALSSIQFGESFSSKSELKYKRTWICAWYIFGFRFGIHINFAELDDFICCVGEFSISFFCIVIYRDLELYDKSKHPDVGCS